MRQRVTEGTIAPEFTFDTPDERGLGFHAAIAGRMAVVYFLRYMGCPICQSKMAELRHDARTFAEKGARTFVVLQSDPDIVRQAMEGEAWPFTVICDPEQAIFARWGVAPGNLLHYLAPSVLLAAFRASRAGFRHGVKEGSELQRPAVFIIDRAATVAVAHFGRTIADVPAGAVIAARLKHVRKAGR